jgi:DNA-binding transcriptional MerR regulator
MGEKFLIGQIARLYDVSIKTLRYYDDIEVFKSTEVNKDTGYRYYKSDQFRHLNTVKFLRLLGVSLKKMKSFLDNRNTDNFIELLDEQKDLIDTKIRALETSKRRIEIKINEITELKNLHENGIIKVQELPERKVVHLLAKIMTQKEIELAIRDLEVKYKKMNLFVSIGSVCLFISRENISGGVFNEYNGVALIPDNFDKREVAESTLPAGTYITAYFAITHLDPQAKEHYEKMLTYIDENSYEIVGDVIERAIIDNFISSDPKECILEVQIPVRKKSEAIPDLIN